MKIKVITALSFVALGLGLSSCKTTSTAKQDPAGGMAASTSAKAKPYPLDVCIVSGEGLDSMGGAITKTYKGQEVKFCCKGCVTDFDANPEKFLAKLR